MFKKEEGQVTEQSPIHNTTKRAALVPQLHWYKEKGNAATHPHRSCYLKVIRLDSIEVRVLRQTQNLPSGDIGCDDGQAIAQDRIGIVVLPRDDHVPQRNFVLGPQDFR